jgi:hypothetical protein
MTGRLRKHLWPLAGASALIAVATTFIIVYRNSKNDEEIPRLKLSSKKRKTACVYLNNSLIWNPSSSPLDPVFAFCESALPLLRRLNQLYELTLISKVSSDNEKAQVQAYVLSVI